MSNYTCEYCRALVERAIEGGYNFLDAIAGVDACAEMNRCMENIELVAAPDMPNKKMFVTHCDIPYKVKDYTLKHYVTQIRNRFLNVLAETYGVDTSDEALRKAVAEHNEVCKIITEIGDLRKAANPVITGYEFHVIQLVSQVCPHKRILPYLKQTLTELKIHTQFSANGGSIAYLQNASGETQLELIGMPEGETVKRPVCFSASVRRISPAHMSVPSCTA